MSFSFLLNQQSLSKAISNPTKCPTQPQNFFFTFYFLNKKDRRFQSHKSYFKFEILICFFLENMTPVLSRIITAILETANDTSCSVITNIAMMIIAIKAHYVNY
jgi:hypothetical protein